MPRRRLHMAAIAMAALAMCLPGGTTAQLAVPFEARVPTNPRLFVGDNAHHLTYELHLTNFGRRPLTLRSIAVSTPDQPNELTRFEGEQLTGMMRRPGLAPDAEHPERVEGGMLAIVFAWVTLPSSSTPRQLTHRITLATETDSLIIVDAPTVSLGPPAVDVGPPLRGDNWFAANGPDNTTGHRRAMIPIDGRPWIAQRFAIDWVQIEDSSTYSGDATNNSNYYAWGEDAIAVADGVVASIKDGIPENVPGPTSRAVPITLETIGGNYVILDIGGGQYAFYAHLQPGSLRVGVGDRVRRGEVIGLVGNSGNSTEPHLHFHIGDGNAPLASEGLPYLIDEFTVRGQSAGFGAEFSMYPAPQRRTRQIPMANELIRFPQ